MRDDLGYFGLDDISLSPFIPPTLQPSLGSNASSQFSWNAVSNISYQIQFTTNLAVPNWQNLASMMSPTNCVMTFTNAPSQFAEELYRILIIP
jgi:hypothetical protein